MNLKKIEQIEDILDGLSIHEFRALKSSSKKERVEYRKKLFKRFDEMIKSQPDYYKGYLSKGNYLIKESKLQCALKVFDEGIKASNDASLYYRKAEIFEEKGKINNAIEEYNKVIVNDLDPMNLYAYCRVAELIRRSSLQDSLIYCQDYFRQYNVKNADDIEEKSSLFKFLLKNMFDLNKVKDAKKEWDKIKNFKSVEKDFLKAFYMLKIGKREKALKLYKQALHCNPYHAEALYEIGGYYSKEKKHKLAGEYLKRAIDIDSKLLYRAELDSDYKLLRETEVFKKLVPLERYSDMLFVVQAKPIYQDDWAFVKIDRKLIKEAKTVLLDARKRNKKFLFVRIIKGKEIQEGEKKIYPLEPNDWYLHLYHYTDKTYDGYHNIYNVVKNLSPFLEDASFFIRACFETWVDEYKIEKGKFCFYRNDDVRCNYKKLLDFYKEKAMKNIDDRDIQYFVSMELVRCGTDIVSDNSCNRLKEIKNTKLQCYDNALHYCPQNYKAYYHKGKLSQSIGDYKKAIQLFSKALKIKPDYTDALFAFGICEYKLKNYKQAVSKYSKLIKIDKKYRDIDYNCYGDLYYCRGVAYELIGQRNNAKKDYIKSIKNTNFHNARILLIIADKLSIKTLYQSSFFYYKSVISKNKEYTNDLRERDKKSQNSSNFYQRYREKINEQNAEAYVMMAGIVVATNGNYERAKEYCNKAIKCNRNSVATVYNVALVYHKCNQEKKAEKYYNKALSLDEKYISAINNKIVILLNRKEYRKALEYANEALKNIDEKHINILLSKGIALHYLKKYKESLAVYKKIIKYAPDLEKGYWGVGCEYSYLKKHKKSIFYYQKALRINPFSYMVLSNIGNNLNEMGCYDEALEYLEKSIKINPDYYHPYYYKACVFASIGREEEALKMVKKTIQLDSSQKESLKKESGLKNLWNNKLFEKLVQEKR